jgi:hypothetical protein
MTDHFSPGSSIEISTDVNFLSDEDLFEHTHKTYSI